MKIKIPSTGQIYNLNEQQALKPGMEILVEADQITEFAYVICDKNCEKLNAEEQLAKFIRVPNAEDLSFKKELKNRASEFVQQANEKVFRHGLEMKIIEADLSFDQKKLTFYFSADGRVDFRSLVADMVGTFRKIIRLQQIGSREEAKIYGGLGKCGRELCCTTFLNNLENITLEMAQIQENFGVKPNKYTGCCGKLMCCLSYEADVYKDMKKDMPKIGQNFKKGNVEGKVVALNVLENKVTIETKEGKRIEVDNQ